MLGYAASPFALTRHLFDYPLTDGPFNIDEYPLPTGDTSTSATTPPPRPPRPDVGLECVSPIPVRAYTPPWMSPYESSGDEDIEMTSSSPKEQSSSPQRQEAPSTPKSSPRSTRGVPVHIHSPVTPSRLSLPPVTALNTDDFTPESVMDSPYRPLYVVPRRQTPELIKLAKKKSMEFSKYNGLKPPKPRRRTVSEQRESFSNCRIADFDPKPNSLADTVRRLIHKFPEVSQSVPTTSSSSQSVAATKTKQRSFSFSTLADKYTQTSLDPNHPPVSPSPSPPPRQSSSRRYGPFSSSPKSSPTLSPSTPIHAVDLSSSPSPNRTPRQRELSTSTSFSTDGTPPSQTWSSSPMQRESPMDRVGSTHSPTTPKALGRTAFYGHPNSPLRHDNSSVRPLSISLPPPPTYESLMAGSTGAYPPTPRGTKPRASGLTSPIGALWEPYTKETHTSSAPWGTERSYDHSSTETVVITSPPDFSRQYKRAGDPTPDPEPKTLDITMGSWNEEDAEGEIDYELETSPITPKAKGKGKLDDIAEGMWLSGQAVDDADENPVDKYGFTTRSRTKFYDQDDEPPMEIPPTPRLANATLPSSGVNGGRTRSRLHEMLDEADFGDKKLSKTTHSDDTPAFLTPFVQRKTHPYNRSANYVLAQTRKREAGIVRAPPGTIRPRKKRAQREITNLCIFTLQRNFTKALQDAEISPKPRPKLIAPPGLDIPPTEGPWWGGRLSPPKQHLELAESSDEENDTDFSEDDEDDEMDDRGMWASQSYGINLGLGLGMGFDFKFPSSPRISSASLPIVERSVDQHSPSIPLVRTPSDKGKSRAKKTVEFDTLSPALDLKDCSNDGGLTPSPVSPEVVTPEFEEESGKRAILVKENYKERPNRGGSMFNSAWTRRLSSTGSDSDSDSDDDRPLWPRPIKKDKGKGRAIPDDEEDIPSSTTTDGEPPIFIPSEIPINPNLSDEVNYNALAEAFGVNADELAMQYMLEMSKLDNGKAAEVIECGDSPGASGSGLPPCHSWTEDEDEVADVMMFGHQSGSSTRSPSSNDWTSSSSGQSSTPTNSFPAAFKSWYDQFTDRDELAHATPEPLRKRIGYGDEMLNEITDLLDPLHIEDTSDDSHDIDEDFYDTCPIKNRRDEDDHNDYDNDSGNNDDDDTSDDDDETQDDDDESGNDVEYNILRDDDDEDDNETQDLDECIDKKHNICNDLTIMNRPFLPELTFTPPSPQVKGAVSAPLRFGRKDDFVNYRTRSPFLRVPELPFRSSPNDLPIFFRLVPAYQQPGKSGEEFAKRMSTKWSSLKGRIRATHTAQKGGGSNEAGVNRPTKLRRIVGDI